jgi:hypothetical protein
MVLLGYEDKLDEDINTTPTPTPSPAPLGPITRVHARQLNHQVSSFLLLRLKNRFGRTQWYN